MSSTGDTMTATDDVNTDNNDDKNNTTTGENKRNKNNLKEVKKTTTLSDQQAKSNEKSPTKTTEPVIKRDQWQKKLDFLIACMGFSIGLGNVWRFPYLCYKNGGGAFLIPYFTSVIIAGIPLFLLEVTMGQLMSRSVIAAWMMCPLFQGIGFACCIVNFLVNTYYTVILGWAYHFLFSSFTTVLPWTKCNQVWNTPNCQAVTMLNATAGGQKFLRLDPATEYWENRVLRISDGIDSPGTLRWDLALCLLLAWLTIFLCICKGIKTSGKVMYVTATSPYVFMLILLIRTCLLDGAIDGIAYYLKPDWSKLTSKAVWSDAGTQIFFSYAIGLGALTTLGSYNKFDHNSLRDCCMFAMANSLTSLLAGFIIFATLGNMAKVNNIPINAVAESGPGLAFVIYPKAIGTMPFSPLWSICFFTMLILLGIDSMFGGVEGFISAITDYCPKILQNSWTRSAFVGSVCLVSYILGLSMVTNGGMYVFQLFDHYVGSRIILVIAITETIAIGYIYGWRRLNKNMVSMYGASLKHASGALYCVITPLFGIVLFILSIMEYRELTYVRPSQEQPYKFPGWAVKIGWLLPSVGMLFIPAVMILRLVITPGTFKERLKFLCAAQITPRNDEENALVTCENKYTAIQGITTDQSDMTNS